MPSCGDAYSYCLRFVNIKSPISYSELEVLFIPQVCAEIGSFLLDLSLKLDAYYQREIKLKTYPTVSISSFVEKLKARSPHIHMMYSRVTSLKKNIVIEFNNKSMKKIFVFHLLIGALRYLKHSSYRSH